MAMRMSGLISGLDTDTLISQLVESKRNKVTKAKGDKTKLEWKQEKWKELNKQLVSLRTTASNLRWNSSWAKKTTNVSNTSKASVITGSGAGDSVQSLKITQLAKSGYLTGGKVKAVDSDGNPTGEKITALSKLSDLGVEGDAKFNITIGDKVKEISVGSDSSVSDVLSALKKEGLNASFDEKNQRFFISSKTTGEAADFNLTASDEDGTNLLGKLGLTSYSKAAQKQLEGFLTYTEADVEAEALKRVQADAENYKDLFNRMKAAERNVDDLTEQRSKLDEDPDATDEAKAELDQKIADAIAARDELTAQKDAALESATWTGTIDEDENGNIVSISDVTFADDDVAESIKDQVRDDLEARKDYAQAQLDAIKAGTLESAATKIDGQNAKISLNGADFESNNNVFEINGLTITALGETADDEEITLTTTNDTSGIYDQIKNLLTTYNKIINELDKIYNAQSSSKYVPLTDEQKEALSETEVEKYETKIKDGLFKGDEAVSNIMSSLTSGMAQGFNIGGKNYFLSSFGINTLGYFEAEKNETHAFHIDGDPDDEKTSGKADKLKAMIASDPDAVSDFFARLSKDLYSRLDSLSSRKANRRSYGSFYEDKVFEQDDKKYDSKITELEDKANKYEDDLYAKFSKMEATMAKLQSKTSALTGFFGGK